jgi:hypothetical protein
MRRKSGACTTRRRPDMRSADAAPADGIALTGDYRAQSNPGKKASTLVPPPEAVMLLKNLVLDIVARHPTITEIYGHGEYKIKGSGCDTDCPSVGVQQLVNAMRDRFF